MKILIIHNCYQQAGGEDAVVNAEYKLLQENGHEVKLWLVDNKDLYLGIRGKLKTALDCSYSKVSKATAAQQISAFKPDIVHVHNFFPQITPAVYDACLEANVPVVQTLHNYRLICPGALLMRDGHICEQCVTGSPYQSVRYGCYRGSRFGTFAVARMLSVHRKRNTWVNKVDAYIVLTEFAKNRFLAGGFPAARMHIKPNFVVDPLKVAAQNLSADMHDRRDGALFVGRLSPEKGVQTLVQAWMILGEKHRLKVIGDGPLWSIVVGKSGINPLGHKSSQEVSRLMSKVQFLVVPSECYEGLPMVILEALSHGLPVLASKLGAMQELIDDGKTGLLFEAGNITELAEKATWLLTHPDDCARMGQNARELYLVKYTPDENYNRLMQIYGAVVMDKSPKS